MICAAPDGEEILNIEDITAEVMLAYQKTWPSA